MLQGPWLLAWVIFWYSGVTFFLWRHIRSIRRGNAGASGMDLDRKKNPARFWIRIGCESFWLAVLALAPVTLLFSGK